MNVQIPVKYIEKAIARYQRDLQQRTTKKAPERKKIITVSREDGTGGRLIAEKIAQKLGCAVWGREILDVLSNSSCVKYQSQMIEALDEKSQNVIDSLVAEFFGHPDKHTYMHLLTKAILIVAQNNAVIIGRGAHLIVPDAFRVRIKASVVTRSHNIMRHEGITENEALRKIRQTDSDRAAFLREFSRKVQTDKSRIDYDLGINADHYDTDEATSIILHAFELFDKKKSQ
jgi:cytidylate kinase